MKPKTPQTSHAFIPKANSAIKTFSPRTTVSTISKAVKTNQIVGKAKNSLIVPFPDETQKFVSSYSRAASPRGSARGKNQGQTRSTATYKEIALANIVSLDQDPNGVQVHTFRIPKEYIHEKEWQLILDMINKKLSQKSMLFEKLQTDIKHLKEEKETLIIQKGGKMPVSRRIN